MKHSQLRSKALHWPLQCYLSPVCCTADMRPERNSRAWHLWGKNARDCGSLTGKRGAVSRKLKEPFPTLSKTILYTFMKASVACLCPLSSWSLILLSQQFSMWMECPADRTVSRTKPTLHHPTPDAIVMIRNQRVLGDPTNTLVWVLVSPLFSPLPL